ncbi:MAG: FKBP-type peptidyl-prolyl cis-trans isomerase [Balneolaceae bacterium]|nr:FKBP-type peptidyl-prolyl cis-trans isomerase [Balneolaceae bacterium]
MQSSRTFSAVFIALFSIVFLSSCDEDNDLFTIDYSLAEEFLFDTTGAERSVTDTGVILYQIENGSGELEVVSRDNILLYYTIRFKPNNAIIESSYANNSTFPLQFNGIAAASNTKGNGFVEAIIGMKEGEKRVAVIPPTQSVYSDTVIVDLELDSILF